MADEEAGRPVLYVARDVDCLIWWFLDWMPSAPPSKIRDAVLAAAGARCGDADVVGIIGWREPQPGGGYIDDFGEICGDGERLWECRG